MGWLDCIEADQPEGQRKTRRELRAGTQWLNLPEVKLDYIAHYWLEMGCVRTGSCPITWSDIGAYAQVSGLAIKPFEAKVIVDMSGAYLAQLSRSDKAEPSPTYTDNRTDEQRAIDVSEKFKQAARRKK